MALEKYGGTQRSGSVPSTVMSAKVCAKLRYWRTAVAERQAALPLQGTSGGVAPFTHPLKQSWVDDTVLQNCHLQFNRKVREADAKAGTHPKQLAESLTELAEQSTLNATLQREKAELAANVVANGGGSSNSNGAKVGAGRNQRSSTKDSLSDEAHVAAAVAAAVAKARAAANEEAAALRSELEAVQVARFKDHETSAAVEGKLRTRAQ